MSPVPDFDLTVWAGCMGWPTRAGIRGVLITCDVKVLPLSTYLPHSNFDSLPFATTRMLVYERERAFPHTHIPHSHTSAPRSLSLAPFLSGGERDSHLHVQTSPPLSIQDPPPSVKALSRSRIQDLSLTRVCPIHV